jgi:hypothetical protein
MISEMPAWLGRRKEITNLKEAQQNLVGWITGLKALAEAP